VVIRALDSTGSPSGFLQCSHKPAKANGFWFFNAIYSPDGNRIVSASSPDKTLKVRDAATGQEILTLKGHTEGVNSVAYSRDGKRIVSGSWDKTVKVWDAATGQETLSLKGHTRPVTSVVFSPDGNRIVSGSQDGTIKIWDATPMPTLSTALARPIWRRVTRNSRSRIMKRA